MRLAIGRARGRGWLLFCAHASQVAPLGIKRSMVTSRRRDGHPACAMVEAIPSPHFRGGDALSELTACFL